jgi:hypothetical protein
MLAGAWSAFSSGNNAPAYVSNTAARTGAHSLRFDHNGLSTSSTEARRALNGPKFVVGLGFGLYMFNLPPLNNLIGIELRSTSNARVIRLSFQSDGSLTAYNAAGVAVAVSDPVMGASSWNHIEIKAVIDTIVGSVEVRVNGVTVINQTDLDLGAIAVSQIKFGSHATSGTVSFAFDDIIPWDDTGTRNKDFLGPQRVQTLFPNGNTALAEWATVGAASGYEAINKTTPDGDTTYIGSDVIGQTSEFTLPTLPPETAAIAGVYIPAMGKLEDAGAGNIQVSLVSGAAVASGPDIPLTTAYTYWGSVLPLDPATGLPWTKAGLEAAKVRIKKTV